jgi:hypothetical protein
METSHQVLPSASTASHQHQQQRVALTTHQLLREHLQNVPHLSDTSTDQQVTDWQRDLRSAWKPLASKPGGLGLELDFTQATIRGRLSGSLGEAAEMAELSTVETLITWVRDWFGITGDAVQSAARRKLLQPGLLKQRAATDAVPQETVFAYYSRFAHTLSEAGEGAMSATFAREVFFRGLLPYLRKACVTDALGEEWTDIHALVKYASGKQKQALASAVEESKQQRTPHWHKQANKPSFQAHKRRQGPQNFNARAHPGPPPAQVNVQVARHAQGAAAGPTGQWQTAGSKRDRTQAQHGQQHGQQHGGGGGGSGAGPSGNRGGEASTSQQAWGRTANQLTFCSTYGLCKKCLQPPRFDDPNTMHGGKGTRHWTCRNAWQEKGPPTTMPMKAVQAGAKWPDA